MTSRDESTEREALRRFDRAREEFPRFHVLVEDCLRAYVRRVTLDLAAEQSLLPETLRAMCTEARTSGIRAEHVIVAIKNHWFALPEVREVALGTLGLQLRSQLITYTLNEYYEGQ